MRHVKNVIVETAELKSEIHGLETVLAVREPTLPARRPRRPSPTAAPGPWWPRRRRCPCRRHLLGHGHRQALDRPGAGFTDGRIAAGPRKPEPRLPQFAYFYVSFRLGGG